MRFDALLMIVVVAVVVGLLLYLPFFLWFRWRERKGRAIARGPFSTPLPRGRIAWMAAFVVVMLAGSIQAHLSPDTWFGKAMQSNDGRFAFALVIALIATAANLAWLQFKKHRASSDAAAKE